MWRCAMGWHKWTRWSKPEMVIGSYGGIVQERRCERCGKVELRAEYPSIGGVADPSRPVVTLTNEAAQ